MDKIKPYIPSDRLRYPLGEGLYKHRGYLPHLDTLGEAKMVTFRLAGSLPQDVLEDIEKRIQNLPQQIYESRKRRLLEHYLDKQTKNLWLSQPDVACLVANSILHFDGTRYHVGAWVVMPNHVHVLIEPFEGYSLPHIVHSWKSFTANKANRILGREGAFWQREYYDRVIRNGYHYNAVVRYINMNPVKAGFCARPHDWTYSSAAGRVERFD